MGRIWQNIDLSSASKEELLNVPLNEVLDYFLENRDSSKNIVKNFNKMKNLNKELVKQIEKYKAENIKAKKIKTMALGVIKDYKDDAEIRQNITKELKDTRKLIKTTDARKSITQLIEKYDKKKTSKIPIPE